MKYYKSKGKNMRLSIVTPFMDHDGGCCSDPICQQQLPLKSTPKSKISNASSVASGHEIPRLSEKNVKYIEDLKKILRIIKQ